MKGDYVSFKWKWGLGVGLLVAVLGLATVVACHCFGVGSLFSIQKGELAGRAEWEDLGPTPLADKGYTPQGMVFLDGKIIWANSWDDINCRVYEIDPKTMTVLRHFDMPEEAVHTSGFTWDGEYLWGVDYISNRAYRIDLEPSLASGKVVLAGSFDTTLEGTSACCMVPWKGKQLLAISDFMNSRDTIFVDTAVALDGGSAANAIVFSYRNEGFSQGLEFADGFLYESENKLGKSVINKMDLGKLERTGDAVQSIVKQYRAPDAGVEDLAWDGQYMWTSDEKVFRFFRGRLK